VGYFGMYFRSIRGETRIPSLSNSIFGMRSSLQLTLHKTECTRIRMVLIELLGVEIAGSRNQVVPGLLMGYFPSFRVADHA